MKKTLFAISLALGLVLSPTTTKPEPKNFGELTENIALLALAYGTSVAAAEEGVLCWLKTHYGLIFPESITTKSLLRTMKHGASALALVMLTGKIFQQMN
jgi:hypothetical protein